MADEASIATVDEDIDRYRVALDALDIPKPGAAAILEALLERDQLAESLDDRSRNLERVQRVADLDERLRKAAARAHDAKWATWRQAAGTPAGRWWWHLDEAQAQAASERSSMWLFLAGALMTATLGLGADISLKLWGSGAGGLSVVSAILTVVFTGGPLTTQGRDVAGWMIDRLRLPLRYRGGTMLAAALVFFVLALLVRVIALPAWARIYNDRGVELVKAGDLAGAQRSLNRAVSINPQYAQGYYNLGAAYLEVGDYDQAGSFFRQALASDRSLDLAYSGLGYVLTVQGKPERAIPILYSGLAVAQDDPARVALWTNLGQAYRDAGRLLEAESALNEALALDPHEAVAHCTLALIAEEAERPSDQIRLHWESCLSYADPTRPRGRELAEMARAHLRLLEEK